MQRVEDSRESSSQCKRKGWRMDTLVTPEFKVGVYPDMDGATYHAVDALSSSGAKKILRSPAHFKLMRDQVSEPTDAMLLGSAIHCGILEPQHFAERVVCSQKFDRRTKEGRAGFEMFHMEHAGKIILGADDHERAQRCVESIRKHPAASKLLDGARTEVSVFWRDGKHGVACKSRFDALNLGGVIDVKSAQDASADSFSRTVASYAYHLQSAFYLNAHEHALDSTPQFFTFVVVETEQPYCVACYELGRASILAGAALCEVALERYAEALKTGEWKGYEPTIQPIEAPAWARRI